MIIARAFHTLLQRILWAFSLLAHCLQQQKHKPKAFETAISLAQLGPGERGRICGYRKGDKVYRQRLLAMGLTPNTSFTVLRRAPLGDPIQICVRDFSLSLRRDEANILLIERER